MPRFTVDTHLFRELGELLVGRDSTALIELIKNSYDADATEVIVHGENLDDPERGRIVVMDTGCGMTREQFIAGFLRVASRLKEQGARRSTVFGRRYTGVKGIGRLAAHKLARKLDVESIHAGSSEGGERTALHAVIDWDAIEQYETLDDMPEGVVSLDERAARQSAIPGTTLTLSRLRRPWTAKERGKFFTEVQAFDAPEFIQQGLPQTVVAQPLLFESPVVRDAHTTVEAGRAGGFQVILEGEFAAGEDYWELMAPTANWVLEIRAERASGLVRFAIAPTSRTLADNPGAESQVTTIAHPAPKSGPFFDARILVREGPHRGKGARDRSAWASKVAGIRVYLEGFRVLPYGNDDWLSMDADYARRLRQLEMLEGLDLASEWKRVDPDEGLTRLPSSNYFGGIFLTQEQAPTLRILVNREGFVSDAGFHTLVDLVRTGVDLSTRVRAASNLEVRRKRHEQRRRNREANPVDSGQGSDSDGVDVAIDERQSLPDIIAAAEASIKEARSLVSQGEAEAAQPKIIQAVQRMDEARQRAKMVISEGSLLRILASVGTQMAAFVHEINGLLGAAQTLERALKMILDGGGLSREDRRRLRQAWAVAADLKQALERHASYLIDVVTPDARRRRSRQHFADRFDAAVRLVRHSAERRHVDIENRIPPTLKSIPMFPAELTTVFANLLTNAVKAAKQGGRIEASTVADADSLRVRIQNTGVAVKVEDGERWFKPFESTTQGVNPVLGQGMGLGLTITRSMLDYYGIAIKFVEPAPAYATAIEMVFPK